MIGDLATYKKLIARDDELAVSANQITKRLDAVEDSIRKIGESITDTSRLNVSKQKIQQIETQNKKLLDEQAKLRQQKEEINKENYYE
jgi:hypothetical protein